MKPHSITNPLGRVSTLLLVLSSAVLLGGVSQGAVITFSTLNNGVNNANDPELATLATITSVYQPLATNYAPTPGSAQDGADLGVTITWSSARNANESTVGVADHTGDTPGGVLFALRNTQFSMVFDQPVEIPSLFWSLYLPGSSGSTSPDVRFQIFNGGGLLQEVSLDYTAGTGYAWQELTAFAGETITEIRFIGLTEALNIDDITINAVPEPAACSLALGGLGALLLRRRRRSA